MQFEYTDSNGDTQTVSAGVSVFDPKEIPHTFEARADAGSAREITHLGYDTQVKIVTPYFEDTDLAQFEEFVASLRDMRSVTVSDPNNDIKRGAHLFPFVAERDVKSVPMIEHLNTSCNNKFRLVLDLLIVG